MEKHQPRAMTLRPCGSSLFDIQVPAKQDKADSAHHCM
jgi:hypothetical protein